MPHDIRTVRPGHAQRRPAIEPGTFARCRGEFVRVARVSPVDTVAGWLVTVERADGSTLSVNPREVTPVTDTQVWVRFECGRREAGSMDCRVCGLAITQDTDGTWRDPLRHTGSTYNRFTESGHPHNHEPASAGPVQFGPFDYAQLTYGTLDVGDGAALANYHGGDWVLTDLAGDREGEAYSDVIIYHCQEA